MVYYWEKSKSESDLHGECKAKSIISQNTRDNRPSKKCPMST